MPSVATGAPVDHESSWYSRDMEVEYVEQKVTIGANSSSTNKEGICPRLGGLALG